MDLAEKLRSLITNNKLKGNKNIMIMNCKEEKFLTIKVTESELSKKCKSSEATIKQDSTYCSHFYKMVEDISSAFDFDQSYLLEVKALFQDENKWEEIFPKLVMGKLDPLDLAVYQTITTNFKDAEELIDFESIFEKVQVNEKSIARDASRNEILESIERLRKTRIEYINKKMVSFDFNLIECTRINQVASLKGKGDISVSELEDRPEWVGFIFEHFPLIEQCQ